MPVNPTREMKKQPPQPFLQTDFFASLKQVEKRLKVEHPIPISPPPPEKTMNQPSPSASAGKDTIFSAEESLSSPMYLHLDQSYHTLTTCQTSSEAPPDFLSASLQFQSDTQDHPRPISDDPADEIERLVSLLNLGENIECNFSDSGGGFYSKIVGVDGPKCEEEVGRLEGWIKLLNNGEIGEKRKEPLRLAYLLLGKAASSSSCNGELDFPSAIKDFLLNDPPTE